MSKPIVKEHNATTGEITEREMNDEEYAAHLAWQNEIEQRANTEQIKLTQRAALLEKLGITEEEAKLLLS